MYGYGPDLHRKSDLPGSLCPMQPNHCVKGRELHSSRAPGADLVSGSQVGEAGERGFYVVPTEQSSGGETALVSIPEWTVEKRGHCENGPL